MSNQASTPDQVTRALVRLPHQRLGKWATIIRTVGRHDVNVRMDNGHEMLVPMSAIVRTDAS